MPGRANCIGASGHPRLPSPAPGGCGWPGHLARQRAVPGHDVQIKCARSCTP